MPLVQVSVRTNRISAAIPSSIRSGNHSQMVGMAGKIASTINGRVPKRRARRGRKGAIASTPTACMAAFSPITNSPWPAWTRSIAISGAVSP